MIVKVDKKDYDRILDLIRYHKLQNLYLYVDSVKYGIYGENIETYYQIVNGEIYCIIYIYYGSIQIIEIQKYTDSSVKELSEYIFQCNVKRISGPGDLLLGVSQYDKEKFVFENGFLMQYEKTNNLIIENLEFAHIDDYSEIVELICTDRDFERSYSKDILLKQMIDRFNNEDCKSVIIRKDNKIVSHFASYVVFKDIAILSGMITDQKYRGKGFGKYLVEGLSSYYLNKKITPFLYCYGNHYLSWYVQLGYKPISKCAKLQLI